MSILIKKFVRMVLESADRNVDQTDDKNPEEDQIITKLIKKTHLV